MKPAEKAIIENLIGRKIDETDAKINDISVEMAESKDKIHPVDFLLTFGRRCFEMGKDEK